MAAAAGPGGFPVVGVVGGGQLARMMAGPAIELGITLRVLARDPADSAAQVVPLDPSTDIGAEDDLEALRRFAKGCDVLTFDHEHVPTEHLRALEADGVVVRPGPDALEHAQDKLHMRRRLTELGVPCPRWAEVASAEDLEQFGAEVGWPVVLKTPRGGYDGKGVRLVSSAADAGDWLGRGGPLLAEERVGFTRELAALVARSPHGQAAVWPVVETVQVDGICREVLAPAPTSPRSTRSPPSRSRCGSPTGSVSPASSRSRCSTRPPACSSTSWPCDRTTAATGPSRARAPASSSSTCARSSTSRWATPR